MDEDESDGYNFTIELIHSTDGKQLTLVILSTEKMTPRAFASALRDYAKSFEEFEGNEHLGETVN